MMHTLSSIDFHRIPPGFLNFPGKVTEKDVPRDDFQSFSDSNGGKLFKLFDRMQFQRLPCRPVDR